MELLTLDNTIKDILDVSIHVDSLLKNMDDEDAEYFKRNRSRFYKLSNKLVERIETSDLEDKYFDVSDAFTVSNTTSKTVTKGEYICIDVLGFAHVGRNIKELKNYFYCTVNKGVYKHGDTKKAIVVDINIEGTLFKAIPMALEENRYFLPTVGVIVTLLENGKTIYSKAYKLYTDGLSL